MNIGLLDVDGHNFPNLALMKLSAYHKAKGDEVHWLNHFERYDIAYKAKVFTFSPDDHTVINAKKIVKGGTGYGLETKLPNEIEKIYPDYSLYGIANTAYGYLTRGCPRDCDFCIVSQKEGRCSTKVANLDQFWKGQRYIKLLDPNLLAAKDKLELLDQLIKSKARVDFTQGLDIRLMSDEVIDRLKRINLEVIHFAWDKQKGSKTIIENLRKFKKETKIGYRKLKVYVLTNFDTDFRFDLYRVYKLKRMGYDPYVMIYNKHELHKDHELKMLQRWVNNKIVFRSKTAKTFYEFDRKIG